MSPTTTFGEPAGTGAPPTAPADHRTFPGGRRLASVSVAHFFSFFF